MTMKKTISDFRDLFEPQELDKLELKGPWQLTRCFLLLSWTMH